MRVSLILLMCCKIFISSGPAKQNQAYGSERWDARRNDDDRAFVCVPDPQVYGLPSQVRASVEGWEVCGFDSGAYGGEDTKSE